MSRDDKRPDSAAHAPADNEKMGSAGHETGTDEPSAVGTAGLYATPIHEEGKEAEAEGQQRAKKSAR